VIAQEHSQDEDMEVDTNEETYVMNSVITEAMVEEA
jgi:hypothetical protein